jgi:protein involved in polysaccharide export with SLBB domain
MHFRNPISGAAKLYIVFFSVFFMALGEQSAVQPPPASDQPIGAQPPVIKDVPVVAQAIETKTEAPRDLQRKPVFHAGDALLITTYPDTGIFFRGIHRIDDQGFADLPIIGKIQVIDKSEKELSDALIAAYVNYLRYPIVQVRPLIRVSLLGGFYRPGLYWVTPESSLWDIVNIAGGTQREDGIQKLRWERSKMLIKTDLVEDFQSGSSLTQMGFNSGDQIWVTPKPNTQFWDIFQTNIIPFLSVTVSIASSALVAYEIYITNHPKQ